MEKIVVHTNNQVDFFSLVRQNAILESILDCIFDDLLIIDKKGFITYISRNSVESLGVNRDELIGKMLSLTPVKITRFIVPGDPFEHGCITGPSLQEKEIVIFSTDEEEIIAGCRRSFCFKSEKENIFKEVAKLKKVGTYLKRLNSVIGSKFGVEDIIGDSKAIVKAKSSIDIAAKSNSTVLLYGESGVGKELFAHAIHSASKRKDTPFVKVDCAAIPDTLLESELFGYEDGAFTGARKGGKPGRFERAHKGTIFLDEVGDMGLPMQAKFLRVLQEREIERIGGVETLSIDVRVIASTRYHLLEKIEKGEFRDDLFYRLEVIPIYIPSLKERKEDIPLLVKHFLKRLNKELGKEIKYVSEDVMAVFMDYPWPGNVRELENVIEGAMNLTTENIIGIKSLHLWEKRQTTATPSAPSLIMGETVRDTEVAQIRRALEVAKGNKLNAARLLGIPRSTLYLKLKKYKNMIYETI